MARVTFSPNPSSLPQLLRKYVILDGLCLLESNLACVVTNLQPFQSKSARQRVFRRLAVHSAFYVICQSEILYLSCSGHWSFEILISTRRWGIYSLEKLVANFRNAQARYKINDRVRKAVTRGQVIYGLQSRIKDDNLITRGLLKMDSSHSKVLISNE